MGSEIGQNEQVRTVDGHHLTARIRHFFLPLRTVFNSMFFFSGLAVSEWFLNLGVEQLRDGSTESFWQSDGPQLLGTSRKIDELLGMVIW